MAATKANSEKAAGKGASTPRRKGGAPAPTGRTTIPAARVKPKQGVTSAKEWKSSARHPVELELPSGNVCLALNKGMQAFVDEGAIPNSLMPYVMDAISQAEKGAAAAKSFADAAGDENLILDMMRLTDSVFLACLREPQVLPTPVAQVWVDPSNHDKGTRSVTVEHSMPVLDVVSGDTAERFHDLLYVDEVDLHDKMFLFQWAVGGTDDVERFREEFAAAVEDVSGS